MFNSQIGSLNHGFTIENSEAIPEFDGTAYIMRHQKSGARLMYLKTDDENKAFAITFKTPPVDDTGVFHILEHSVLCGSKKFPVKEPFVNLLKSSMQTFLNAMTFPDKTMYPVASTNEQDLINLMDVYMDAVLNPNIYEKAAIFEQEGWHYELDSDKDPLRYNGVVFNEMKGALSDPDTVLYDALCEALFPDTCYAYESGGSPDAIPTLSYEAFLDAHRRHYQLDNSYILLYGDMQVEKELEFLDENYLSVEPTFKASPNPLVLQKPVKNLNVVKQMLTTPENASLGIAYVAGEVHERERILALDILIDTLMGSNEAPLKRAILDSQIADDAHGYLVDEQLQPVVVLQLKGCKPEAKERFYSLIQETVTKLQKTGIPKERLEASLSRGEFAVRERDFGIADGVVLGIQSMTGWLYDDSMATSYLHYEDAFKDMREEIENGYFEQLLGELFLANDHVAQVSIVPVESLDEESETEKLAAIKASLSPEELAKISDEATRLRRIQEEPDSADALATLPLLRLEDIGKPRPDPTFCLREDTPLPCLCHDIPTRQINYVYHYFDIDCLTFEDLPYIGILMRLFGKLDTELHTADELDYLTQARLGSMRFFVEAYGDENDPNIITPKFVISVSALAENIKDMVELPSEIWSLTRFDDKDKIRDILLQSRIALEQEFASAGHSAALSRVSSYYNSAAVFREQIAGVDFYRFVKDLLQNYDEKADNLVKQLYSVSTRLFVQDGTISSFTGTEEDNKRFWDIGGTLRLTHCGTTSNLVVPAPVKRNEAFIVPTDICFAAQGYDRRLLDIPYSGVWQTASRVLSYDYLWSQVRVKGGAYGAGFRADRSGGMQFYSFRDPHIDRTFGSFTESGRWLSTFSPDEESMRGYIISSVAGYDTPRKARELSRRQDAEFFSHLDPGWRLTARSEALASTPAKLNALASTIDKINQAQALCVFGNRELLEKSKRDFKIVDLLSSNE